jgi:mono/diheme cytochrome c family protein
LIPTFILSLAGAAVAQLSDAEKVQDAMPGKELFHLYCAGCHGADARGKGPVAVVLKRAPTDLTQLSKKNGGTFPTLRVSQTIRGDVYVQAHGPREMPVYGDFFRDVRHDEKFVELRIDVLTGYLASMQRK